MRTFTPPRMHVVRKEEKEARLSTFVGEMLAADAACGSSGRELSVIARSFDSPVLKALTAHAEAILGAGWTLRAVIVLNDGAKDAVDGVLAGVPIRCSCDARLLDAHEQLALGDRVAWIGDCMRREPAKRDAYEIYSHDCTETAALAHRSFARVWAFAGAGKADPVAAASQPAADVAPVDVPMAAIAEGETAPLVSTRH